MFNGSEAPSLEVIVVDNLRTYLSVNYGLTRVTKAILTPEKRIQKKKRNLKSIDLYPPGKDPITNQDKNTLGLQKYQCLLSHVPPFSSEFK